MSKKKRRRYSGVPANPSTELHKYYKISFVIIAIVLPFLFIMYLAMNRGQYRSQLNETRPQTNITCSQGSHCNITQDTQGEHQETTLNTNISPKN